MRWAGAATSYPSKRATILFYVVARIAVGTHNEYQEYQDDDNRDAKHRERWAALRQQDRSGLERVRMERES